MISPTRPHYFNIVHVTGRDSMIDVGEARVLEEETCCSTSEKQLVSYVYKIWKTFIRQPRVQDMREKVPYCISS